MSLTLLTKDDLSARYLEILTAGSLAPDQQARVHAGDPVPGVVIQQSSGSSGAAPLRIPKSPEENAWLLERWTAHHRRVWTTGPTRIAFVGGITHLEAGRVDSLFPGGVTRSFRLSEWSDLLRFDPDLLSTYPSVARALLRGAAPAGLRTLKLGGEPVLSSDRAWLHAQLPELLLLEQFGSTEMPGLAFRAVTRARDSGYLLSHDRYAFQFSPPTRDGWRALSVRDTLPGRAFPIPGPYATGDEVRLVGARVAAVRRADDPALPHRAGLEHLLAQGVHEVQLLLEPEELWYRAAPDRRLPPRLLLGGQRFRTVRGPVARLRASNKAPFALLRFEPTRHWRPGVAR